MDAIDVALALDVSTSVIGWTMLTPGSTIMTYPKFRGHIDLRKVKGGFWKKVEKMAHELNGILTFSVTNGLRVVAIYIEEPLKKFTRGKSSANTLSMLARFNALVSYRSLITFGIEPLYIDATAARKKIGIPLLSKKKSGGLSQKEQTFAFLSKGVFLNESWPTNKNGNIQPYVYDEVDSFVICVAGCQGLGEPA